MHQYIFHLVQLKLELSYLSLSAADLILGILQISCQVVELVLELRPLQEDIQKFTLHLPATRNGGIELRLH